MSNTTTGAATKFEAALHSWPSAGAGVHSHMMGAANLAAIAGLNPSEAEREIIRTMPRPPSPSAEVAAAIRKAYSEHRGGATDYCPSYAKPTKPKPKPDTARRFILRGDGADEAAWWEASPIRIDWQPGPQDALALLGALYAPDEYLFIGERYGVDVATVGDWMRRIESGGPCPPHFIPNPLTGQEHPLPDGKLSRRGDSAVVSFKYAVAEMDCLSKPDQLALWWGFKSAPVTALIDSGGKSIHAILKVDMASREQWEAEIENKLFPNILCPLGCDPACRNEARLSRLPGHYRREKGAWQRLLYLDPSGEGRGRA